MPDDIEVRYTGLAQLRSEGAPAQFDEGGSDTVHPAPEPEFFQGEGFHVRVLGDTVTLSTGREFYANWGTIGIGGDGCGVSEGADGGVETGDWGKEDRRELAAFMIAAWQRFAEGNE